MILDPDNNIITKTEQKFTRWQQCKEELFGDENISTVTAVTDRPTITQAEVESAGKLKNNKIMESDQIQGVFACFKLLDSYQTKLLTTP